MQHFPPPIERYLYAMTEKSRRPAWLAVDRLTLVIDWGGATSDYGLEHLTKGSQLVATLELLDGILPLAGTPVVLPAVQTAAHGCADIHLIPGDDCDWVLLLDGTAEVERRRMVQQQVNELALLRERETRTLARMTYDLKVAARVQQALLPRDGPSDPRVTFAWAYLPCDELAGDIFNVFQIDDNHMGVYLLDVSGHGVAAALLAVAVSRILAPTPGHAADKLVPLNVVNELNRQFPFDCVTSQYFTILYGVLNLEQQTFSFVSAGHPLPILISDSTTSATYAAGPPIGVLDAPGYMENLIALKPGDRLFIYSDGVVEAMAGAMEQFGVARAEQQLRASSNKPMAEGIAALLSEVTAWSARVQDDLSIVAFAMKR